MGEIVIPKAIDVRKLKQGILSRACQDWWSLMASKRLWIPTAILGAVSPEVVKGVLDVGNGIVAALIEAAISTSAIAGLVFMVSVVHAPFAKRRDIGQFPGVVDDATSAKDLA